MGDYSAWAGAVGRLSWDNVRGPVGPEELLFVENSLEGGR